MNRNALNYLKNWLSDDARRLPIVLRGARQVGKTWLVRQLAKETGLQLIEFNFEREPFHKELFASNDPKKIVLNIESALNRSIDINHSLLFLDEIQAVPELLAKLRWFAEDMPELPVITAGSLLEFVLDDHTFSMPVGRISYVHLEPLSFEEFLMASKREKLLDYVHQYTINQDAIPLPIHTQLLSLFKEYVMIGGLPAAVASWTTHQSLEKVQLVHHDLLATYRDDFSKYARKIPIERLDEIIYVAPKLLGKKFVYRQVNQEVQTPTIKKALDLLCKARVCHRVYATHANGIPMAAEIKEKTCKVILLDTGLVSAALDLSLHQLNQLPDINLVNQGAISEQMVGQLLRCVRPLYVQPHLYYWTREESNASSEIDYLIQHHTHLVPIEVKSGTTGTLKSLHYFMAEKKLPIAVRICSDLPSITQVNMKTNTGKTAQYTLLSIPFYFTEQIHRLLAMI